MDARCSIIPPAPAVREHTWNCAWRHLAVSKDRRLGRGLAALLGTMEEEERIAVAGLPTAPHSRLVQETGPNSVPAPHFPISASRETASEPLSEDALLRLNVYE